MRGLLKLRYLPETWENPWSFNHPENRLALQGRLSHLFWLHM